MTKTILITGCSSGIGLHCAKRLQEDGWTVFATARKKQDIKDLKELGLNALHLDYEDEKSIHTCFNQVMKATNGKLDALFNNGAYAQPGAVEDLPTSALRQQFEANFFGWHELTRLVMPIMRQQKHGRIVHCSSVLGFAVLPWRGAYNASKFALEGLASTMRLELHKSGIHISLIQPGPIVSKIGENSIPHIDAKIDAKNSVFAKVYVKQYAALHEEPIKTFLRLEPEAVYKKLKHALNATAPKPNYYVTFPTHLFGFLKRILPQRLLDLISIKFAEY
ncbi:MAG: SDR family oxidoreductase [Nitratireductor sp.]